MVGGEGGKWKGLQKGDCMCCNVVMCAVVTGWGEGGKSKVLQNGVFMCCNVVMCGVVTGWGRGMELESVTEWGFYVL